MINKNRILAGALVLLLSSSHLSFVKGEGQLVDKPQNTVIQVLQTDYNIHKEDYFKKYNYKYVNSLGEERWYASYLDEIDGFKRTLEKERISSYIPNNNQDNVYTNGDYAYLYHNNYDDSLMPFYSDEQTVSLNGDDYTRTIFITEASNETLRILQEYNLYRLVDNLSNVKWELKSIHSINKYGYLCYKPIKETSEGLEVEPIVITDIDEVNLEEMGNYLVGGYLDRRLKYKDQIVDKTIIIKRVDNCKTK